jgi:hypothetical protein
MTSSTVAIFSANNQIYRFDTSTSSLSSYADANTVGVNTFKAINSFGYFATSSLSLFRTDGTSTLQTYSPALITTTIKDFDTDTLETKFAFLLADKIVIYDNLLTSGLVSLSITVSTDVKLIYVSNIIILLPSNR